MSDDGPTRYSPVTPDDHAGLLWITALLSLIFYVFAFFTRAYIKYKKWSHDDTVCLVATIFGIASFASLGAGLGRGLGKSSFLVSQDDLAYIGKSIFASQLLLIITLGLAKVSVILLVKRCLAYDMTRQRRMCDIVTGGIVVWALASIIGISVKCVPSQVVNDLDRCPRQSVRWEVIGIFNGLFEIVTVSLSILLVWDIKNLTNEQRTRVILAFLFRLLLIPVIVMHIYYYMLADRDGANVSLAITSVLICEQIQIGVSLLTATVPNMKAFIQGFNSQLGMVGMDAAGIEAKQQTMREASVAAANHNPSASTKTVSPPATSKSSTDPNQTPAPSSSQTPSRHRSVFTEDDIHTDKIHDETA